MAGSKYVTILEGEFDTIFKAEKGWKKDYSGKAEEVVYTKCLLTKPHIMVKVYSSIQKNSSVSRGVGQDSIKICAINIKTDRGVMKTKRIHRTPGWEQRTIQRVKDVWEHLVSRNY